MKKIYSIYKISNKINNNTYIGFTSRKIESRWKQHLKDSKSKNNTIYKAFRKYGIEAFYCVVIYQTLDMDHAKYMEKYFITAYNTYKNGYNETMGGDGTIGYNHSNKTKKKISDSIKENPNIYLPKSKTHKNRISRALKGNIDRNDKWKERQSISQSKITYLITYKNGKTDIITSLNKFAKDNGYEQAALNRLYLKKQKSSYNIQSITAIE
jgi:group I intron endonuclease